MPDLAAEEPAAGDEQELSSDSSEDSEGQDDPTHGGPGFEIPLFPASLFASVSGEVIEATFYTAKLVSLFRRLIQEEGVFGVRPIAATDEGFLARIVEYPPSLLSQRFPRSVRFKAKKGQKFEVLSTKTHRSVVLATARIKPDVVLPKPLVSIKSFHKLRLEPVGSGLGQREVKRRKVSAAVTPWPAWVFEMYDEEDLANRVRQAMANRCDDVQLFGEIPTDPTELSYWVARKFHLRQSDVAALLQLNSCVQRLRYELSLFAIHEIRFCCRECLCPIGRLADVIPSSEAHGALPRTSARFTMFAARPPRDGKAFGKNTAHFEIVPGRSIVICGCTDSFRVVGSLAENPGDDSESSKCLFVMLTSIKWSLDARKDEASDSRPHC